MSLCRPGRLLGRLALVLALFGGIAFASAAPTDDNQVIVPNRTPPKASAPTGGSLPGPLTAFAVLVLAGAGAWLVWRGRAGGVGSFSRASRQLNVEETRSLGGRQYLVIASYQDKKFLLGVCPGKIDLLAALHDGAPAAEKPKS